MGSLVDPGSAREAAALFIQRKVIATGIAVIVVSFSLVLVTNRVNQPRLTTEANAQAQSSPGPSAIISDNTFIRGTTNSRDKLQVMMTAGKKVYDPEPGPFMGDRWEGNFALVWTDEDGKKLGQLSLNEAFGQSSLIFTRSFPLLFDDYNKDGYPDVAIGQWGSSNGYVYRLFTIGPDGIAQLPVENSSTLFNSSSEYSVRFTTLEQPGFQTSYYDNSTGTTVRSYFLWEDNQFHAYPSPDALLTAYQNQQLAELSREHLSKAFPELMVKKSLVIGDTQEQVKSLLGEPDAVRAVGFEDHPAVYAGWRYENTWHQLDITWSEQGNVLEYNLTYKASSGVGGQTVNFHALPYGLEKTTVTNVPLIPSRQSVAEWKFSSGLRYNFLVGRAVGTLLVLGHDGLYSGHHNDSILYGVDAESGRKLWEVPAKFEGLSFALSSDRKHTAVLTFLDAQTKEYETKLQWIDVLTGQQVWEQKWKEQSGKFSRLSSAKGVVVLEERQDSSSGSAAASLRVLQESSGSLLWEKKLSADEKLLYDNSSNPFLIVIGSQSIRAYDPLSGRIVWSRQAVVKDTTINNQLKRYLELSNSDNRSLGSEPTSRLWLLLEGGYTCLDITSGAVIAVLPYEPGNFYKAVNDDYMFIYKSDSPDYWRGTTFTTSLYNLKRQTTVWQTNGRGRYSAVAGNTLYYLLDDRPVAVELASGKQLWQSPYTVKDLERDQFKVGDKQPIVVNDELWVPGREQVFVFDRHTGELKNKLGNIVLGSAATKIFDTDYGMLNKLDDGLYVGSANGTFQKLKSEQ